MAPTITAAMTNSEEHLTLTHKLRKPLVEKLRRERINSSIEQLKSLLGPEFLQQQPDSKMEKADILEMTVCFLRRQQQQQQQQHHIVDSAALNQGYTTCAQEVVNFLSKEEVKTKFQRRLKNHFNKLQSPSDNNMSVSDFCFHTSITKEKSSVSSALWRPW
uniref:Transcription factor HES-5 n=2 Tax=Sphaeramia orbicularis TaxID=375764 RepID=A0A672Z8T4_9TELE